jgi:multicomponent Na+:H+ antiporter subunit E
MKTAIQRISAFLYKALPRGLLFAGLWGLLTAGDPASWLVGTPVVLAALAASLWLQPAPILPFHPVGVAKFLSFFLWQSLLGGFRVALLALNPWSQPRPAVLTLSLRLPEESARILLANTLSLLPGTVSSALSEDAIRLHVLDARQPLEQERDLRELETRIARLLKIPLG